MCGTSNLTGPNAHNIIYPYNIPIIYINRNKGNVVNITDLHCTVQENRRS